MGHVQHLLGERSPLTVLRHHDTEIGVDLRHVPRALRIDKVRETGRIEPQDRGDVGDIGGAVFYAQAEGAANRGTRGPYGQWSYGALSIEQPDGLRAVLRERESENQLAAKHDVTEGGAALTPRNDEYRNTFGRPLPLGTLGLLVQSSTQDEWSQWLLPSSELVAHHRGSTPRAGPPDCSSRIYDLTPDGYLDWERGGGLHSLVWVRPLDGGEHQPLWNLRRSAGDATGWGGYYCDGDGASGNQTVAAGDSFATIAWASWLRGGPFHPGHATSDRHRQGFNAVGEAINPGHIWIEALFYKNKVEDGELHHTRYVEGRGGGFPTKVYFGFRHSLKKWDWWTTQPIIPPPWVPYDPPTETPPNFPVPRERVPGGPGGPPAGGPPGRIVIERDRVPGSDDLVPIDPFEFTDRLSLDWRAGIGQLQLEPGQALVPRSEAPANPALHDQELGLPSLNFTGIRDRDSQPGDGRYGGPGGDSVFPGVAEAEELAGPQGDFADILARRRAGAMADPVPGRLGTLSKAAIRRGGPTPLTAHLYALPKVTTDGRWDYKQAPGRKWGNGTASWAALVIGPHHVPDGVDDQSEWVGELDVMLYNGWRGGTATGTRFGWGTPSQATGDWSDGAMFGLTGASDTLDLELTFRDAAGASRTGTLTSYGLLGLSDGAIGTATGAWFFKDDTDCGLARIGADQFRWFAAGAARLAVDSGYVRIVNVALLSTDGSATDPGFSFNSDPDVGIWRVGANQLGLVAGGSLGAGSRGALRLTTALFGPGAGEAQIDLGAMSAPWGSAYFSGNVSIGGKLTVTGMIDPSALVLDEQSADPWTPAAANASLWLKNDTDQRLMLTDDAGATHVLTGPQRVTATIASGAITLPDRIPRYPVMVELTPQGGMADDLDTITPGAGIAHGQLIVLTSDGAHDITVTAAGNMVLAGAASATIGSEYATVMLMWTGYSGGSGTWIEVSRSANAI